MDSPNKLFNTPTLIQVKIDFSLNPLRHNDSGRKADAGKGKAITLLSAGIDFYQSFMDLSCVPDGLFQTAPCLQSPGGAPVSKISLTHPGS